MAKKIIEFFSSVKGVAETFPIKSAKEVIPSWVNEARKDFLIQQKKAGRELLHITRCPGIFHLFNTGYIVSAWHDIEIRGEGEIVIPDNMMNNLLEKDAVTVQGGDNIAKFIPKRPWSHPSILKLNTPWHILAPKGIKFLMIPIPYTDYLDFESCIGILDPGYSSEINVQGYWNKTVGVHLIKAGTPIAQLIPLTEKSYDYVVRDMNQNDERWIKKRRYLNHFSFQFARNLVRNAYIKHVKGREI